MTESEQEQESKPQPAIIEKYDCKTIRVSKRGYGSRVYRISIEYVEAMMLEVNLVPLSDDGSLASSTYDWANAEDEAAQRKGELFLVAVRKAKDIAREIEQSLDVDFDEDEVD